MQKQFEITKEILLGAKSYVPLQEKERFARTVAEKCCDVATSRFSYDGAEILAPEMRVENFGLRQRYMMGALYKVYLGVDFEPVEDTEWCMAVNEYDWAASTFPMNRLERFKSDAALRDKVFDLLRDYKELDRMVSVEIGNLIAANNDVVARLLMALSMAATPEAIEQLSDAERQIQSLAQSLKGTIGEAQEAVKGRGTSNG